jgi:hypothetical protein
VAFSLAFHNTVQVWSSKSSCCLEKRVGVGVHWTSIFSSFIVKMLSQSFFPESPVWTNKKIRSAQNRNKIAQKNKTKSFFFSKKKIFVSFLLEPGSGFLQEGVEVGGPVRPVVVVVSRRRNVVCNGKGHIRYLCMKMSYLNLNKCLKCSLQWKSSH